jgi:hypothetical protein
MLHHRHVKFPSPRRAYAVLAAIAVLAYAVGHYRGYRASRAATTQTATVQAEAVRLGYAEWRTGPWWHPWTREFAWRTSYARAER